MGLLAVDSTTHSTIVLCRACGARFAATSRAAALTLAAPHTATHSARDARDARERARRIHTRSAGRG